MSIALWYYSNPTYQLVGLILEEIQLILIVLIGNVFISSAHQLKPWQWQGIDVNRQHSKYCIIYLHVNYPKNSTSKNTTLFNTSFL